MEQGELAQPVILGPGGEVLSGHHRVIAAQLAGIDLKAVPGSDFLGFVRDLMTRLGMGVRIYNKVPPEQSGFFSLRQFAEFADVVGRLIAVGRARWAAAFGATPLAAATNEVYQRIILPRCQPGVGPPT